MKLSTAGLIFFIILSVFAEAKETRRTLEYWKTVQGYTPIEVVRSIKTGQFVTWRANPDCVEKFFILFIALKGFENDTLPDNEKVTNLAERACTQNISMQCIREKHNNACSSGTDCNNRDESFEATMQAFITCGLAEN